MTKILLVVDPKVPTSDMDDGYASYLAECLADWLNTDLGPRYSQGVYHVAALPRAVSVPAPDPNLWLIHMITTSEIQGALGYHHRDTQGTPVGFVAVESIAAIGYGQFLFSVLCHEAAEMVGNRFINEWVDDGTSKVYFQEICDPAEGNLYTHVYKGNRLAVPDYVLPAYWRSGAPGPYSRMGLCPAPFTPARGGRQTTAILTSLKEVTGV